MSDSETINGGRAVLELSADRDTNLGKKNGAQMTIPKQLGWLKTSSEPEDWDNSRR